MFRHMQNSEIIRKMTEEFDEVIKWSAGYVFIFIFFVPVLILLDHIYFKVFISRI